MMLHVRLSGNQEKENVAFDERPEWRGLVSLKIIMQMSIVIVES